MRGADLHLQVTGNPHKIGLSVAQRAPPNVHFTGFLADEDYWQLLRSADAIIDLTSKADCLVCGAYEALALGKPMLLSDNTASRELFGEGAVLTDNSTRTSDAVSSACAPSRRTGERPRSASAPSLF